MEYRDGKYYFGFWDDTYGAHTDEYEDFKCYENTIDKENVIKHIETLEDWLTSAMVKDRFTGELFNAGLYQDGDFVFSVDFF